MVKNQHYVPRFYLNHFLNNEGRFCVFNKDTSKKFVSNPQSVANENFFYDLADFDSALAVDQPVEQYLSKIESLHGPLLDSFLTGIDNRSITEINSDQRAFLTEFMMFQIIRTKEHRETMFQCFSIFKDSLAKRGWLDDTMVQAMQTTDTANEAKRSQLSEIFHDEDGKKRLVGILDKHIMIVFKNFTTMPYYTSDHPVVKIAHDRSPYRSNSGYKSPGIEIAVPLSSSHLIVLRERSHFKEWEQFENDVLVHQEIEHVTYYNSMQVSQSYRAVICRDDNFDLAFEMVKAHPSLQQVDYPRLRVD